MSIAAVSGVRRAIRELVDGTIRVQVDIDPAFRQAFFRLLPEIDMPVALAPLRPTKQSAQESVHESDTFTSGEQIPGVDKPPNELARRMHVDGYFRNPKLWRALHERGLYTLAEHKKWIEQQSCVGANFESLICAGDICAHHADKAEIPAAGRRLQPDAPQKPPHWYTVPLCHKHHEWVHTKADRAFKARLHVEAVTLIAERAKATMKTYLGIASLREITEEMKARFEREIGL